MPFYHHKKEELHSQIKSLINGDRVPVIEIGYLTQEQHDAINQGRSALDYPPLESPKILYLGKHHVGSRHGKDGYNADDILEQIMHILDTEVDIPITPRQTKMVSKTSRLDAYGNTIIDTGILELMSRRPKAELYSVIPKGDNIKPNQFLAQKKAS